MKQKEGYGEYAMVGGIIDHFGWSKIKREKSSSSFGQTYFGVVFFRCIHHILIKQKDYIREKYGVIMVL